MLDLLKNNKFYDEVEEAPASPDPISLAQLVAASSLCGRTVPTADLRAVNLSLEDDGTLYVEVIIGGAAGPPPIVCVATSVVVDLWFATGTPSPATLIGQGPEGYSRIARILRKPVAVTTLVVDEYGMVTAADNQIVPIVL